MRRIKELAACLGKLRGTTRCALCDITHRGVVANQEWRQLSCQIAVPFDFVHRNERAPELEPLNGDAAAFLDALTAKAARLSLSIPGLEEQPR